MGPYNVKMRIFAKISSKMFGESKKVRIFAVRFERNGPQGAREKREAH